MGSGGTESSPTLPDEFRPFITGTLGRYMGGQALNPISGYFGNNAMDVEGMTPFQQLAMGYSAGNMQQSPMDLMAMQAAQRAAGMAGAGPTTGQYNAQGEMGLQDWAELMNPYVARGGELGQTTAPTDFLHDAEGGNAPPQGPLPPNYQGGPPVVGGGQPNSPPYPGGGGGSNPGQPPAPGGGGGAPPFSGGGQPGPWRGRGMSPLDNQGLRDAFMNATEKYGVGTSGFDANTGFATLSGLPGNDAGYGRGAQSFSFGGHGAPAARMDLQDMFLGQGMDRQAANSASNEIAEAGRLAAQSNWAQISQTDASKAKQQAILDAAKANRGSSGGGGGNSGGGGGSSSGGRQTPQRSSQEPRRPRTVNR